MLRRLFLSRLAALPLFGAVVQSAETSKKPLKIMMKSAWGSDDPTGRRSRSCTGSRWPMPDTKCRFFSPAKPPT
jgi:hypothetical protein